MEVLIAVLILVGGFLVTTAIAIPLENRRLRRVERDFYAYRPRMTDAEFLRLVSSPTEVAGYFLGARRAMGELCGADPEFIHPQDSMRLLLNMQWDGGYIADLALYTEKHADIHIDMHMSETQERACA